MICTYFSSLPERRVILSLDVHYCGVYTNYTCLIDLVLRYMAEMGKNRISW